tara:strand:- start:743 stop:1270 length:528 start_codon:yes stop_codon:yes gene_type:complete
MPGAYLKGNSSFPGSTFIVDEVSRPWNTEGTATSTIINNRNFTSGSSCTVQYYKLKKMVSLYISVLLKPSSLPYTGVENDTSYIYTGNFAFSNVNTTADIRIDPILSAAPYHFETSVNIDDYKTGVFFDTNLSAVMGMIHLNGILDPTLLRITIPTGMLPNHEYNICGTMIYECL